MGKLWQALNGKKTYIAFALLFASTALEEVVHRIWGLEGEWIPKSEATLDWLGMALGATGVGHKIWKNVQANKTEETPQ